MKHLHPLFCAVLAGASLSLQAESTTIAAMTEGMQKCDGFFTFWWDDDKGRIWLEIDKLDQEFIHVNPVAIAETAADHTLALLLHPERCGGCSW